MSAMVSHFRAEHEAAFLAEGQAVMAVVFCKEALGRFDGSKAGAA